MRARGACHLPDGIQILPDTIFVDAAATRGSRLSRNGVTARAHTRALRVQRHAGRGLPPLAAVIGGRTPVWLSSCPSARRSDGGAARGGDGRRRAPGVCVTPRPGTRHSKYTRSGESGPAAIGLDHPLVDPAAVEKRRRRFEKTAAGSETWGCDRVDVDGEHAVQQEHAAEQPPPGHERNAVEPLIPAWIRRADDRHELGVDVGHAHDAFPTPRRALPRAASSRRSEPGSATLRPRSSLWCGSTFRPCVVGVPCAGLQVRRRLTLRANRRPYENV
jgi:hypothetical protein